MQLCLATGFWAVAGKTLQRKCFESWAVLDTMQVRHTAGRERHSTLSGYPSPGMSTDCRYLCVVTQAHG